MPKNTAVAETDAVLTDAEWLRRMADEFNRPRVAHLREVIDGHTKPVGEDRERKVQKQIARFFAFAENYASRGAYEVRYQAPLCKEALRRLMTRGFEIREDGDHDFFITWAHSG